MKWCSWLRSGTARVIWSQFKQQQFGFEQRRADLELKVQEMQLENELRMLHDNPDRITPGFNSSNVTAGVQGDFHNTFNPGIPVHQAENKAPLNLGLNQMADELIRENGQPSQRLKKDGTPDLRYKS